MNENKNEKLNWQMLVDIKNEIGSDILKQQIQINEYVKLFKDKIDANPEIGVLIVGLHNTILDLVNTVRDFSILHSTSTKTLEDGTVVADGFRTGDIEDDSDDYFLFMKYYNGYISTREKLAHIVATAYMDIFSRLKSEEIVKELGSIRDQGIEDIKKETEGVMDGAK
jgi:hypothetical protein